MDRPTAGQVVARLNASYLMDTTPFYRTDKKGKNGQATT